MQPSREAVGAGNNEPNGATRETVAAMLEITKVALSRRDSALIWGVDVYSLPGATFPNVELGNVLLSQCLAQPGRGLAWSYLNHALAAQFICPLLTLALLTARVIPTRQQNPELYQMYIELTSNFICCLGTSKSISFRERCIKYVDEALQLSQMGETPVTEFGTCIAYFLFSLGSRLTDAISEDWNSPPSWNEKQKLSGSGMHGQMSHGANDMEADAEEKQRDDREQMKRNNSLLALELLAKIMQNKGTSTLLRLVRRLLPEQWSIFFRALQSLEVLTRNPTLSAPKEAQVALGNLASAMQQGLHCEWRPTQLPVIQAMLDNGPASCNAAGVGCISPWLPFDIYMESAMEKQRLQVEAPSCYLAGMMRTLQAVQGVTWHEVFLGLWTAALRLVHRDREWVEGPKPHVDSRLCMLLSLVPLACVIVIDEEEKGLSGSATMRGDSLSTSSGNGDDKDKLFQDSRRAAFILSLQVLGHFEALLYPPKIAVSAANKAAASIAAVVASMNANAGMASDGSSKTTAGNLRHLIVEACISRGLLDTSAYFWLSKTGSGGTLSSPSNPPQSSPWTVFMEGAPLSSSLQTALMSSPAESLTELEKVYQTAISGPEEERAAAASILCGASLTRSWNVQEHAVQLAVRLLSPPSGPENRGSGSHLIAYAPMLTAALDSITSVDSLNILGLFGMFPELAASLLPICEVFGSLPPTVPRNPGTGEDVYKTFSLAFLLLVRLWKFHRPPLEHCLLGSGPGIGADLSLEYLLQIRAMQTAGMSHGDKSNKDPLVDQMQQSKRPPPPSPSFTHSMSTIRSPIPSTPTSVSHAVTLDSFPKLKAWYTQHQACIASTLSSLVRGNPVHQVADRLLNVMFKKYNKSTSSTSSNNSGGHGGGDEKPALPAWEVIAAVPFVVDEVLTACSHGRLSPRELTTGLRDLIDFLPATFASFVSCCGAEVYRGLYKPASMNGNDWPSPAANLFAVEAEMQSILSSAGVNIPNLVTGAVGGNGPAALPLPLAALVSLTITFKLDRQSDMILGVAGPALHTASAGGPWPSVSVVAALWSQKMRRWHEFIVLNATRAVFKQNKHAMSQLLRSCFQAVLGTATLTSKLQSHGGVGALLGHGDWLSNSPALSTSTPGMLYLRAFPTLHDIMFVSDELLELVAESSRELAMQGLSQRDPEATANTARLRCVQPSLSTAIARAVQASTLGASLLTVSGGATLVRKLYLESLPTWFLSGVGPEGIKFESKGTLIEGYAIARFVLLSGALAWGISPKNVPLSSQFGSNSGIPQGMPHDMRRQHVLGTHLDFLASGLDGKISIRCKQTIWKAYIIGFVALMVTCAPSWILDVKLDTLQRLATGLRWWRQHELAFALLERGGPAAVGAAAELALG